MKKPFKTSLAYLGVCAIFFFILTLAFVAPTFAANGPGTTGAVELKIPVSPRAIAMGQAFVAVADDATAIYWNPAGLNQMQGSEVTAEYDVFIETVTYNYGSLAIKLGNDAALGVAGKMLSTGYENETDINGNLTGNTFNETYTDIDLTFAYRLGYTLDIGITAKYITKTLAGTSASTYAADLGVLYQTPIAHLKFGLNVQNIGPGLTFVNVADPLPFNVKTGFAYKMFDDNFTLAYDMNFPNDDAISSSFGGEYWYKNTLVGRFGYQLQGSIDQNQLGIGGKAGLYLGAGVKVSPFNNFNVGLDYAWTDQGILGSNHHFALNCYF